MVTALSKKEHPISMRLPSRDIDLIDRAASIRGSSRTEFVREAAVRAAADVVMERAVISMSAAGFAAFAKAIAGKGKPVRELVKILSRKAPWE